MMQAAAETDGAIMLAYALDSTYEPSLALLDRALEAAGTRQTVHPLPLTQYWPLFEAGETEAFTSVIAGEIRQAAMTCPSSPAWCWPKPPWPLLPNGLSICACRFWPRRKWRFGPHWKYDSLTLDLDQGKHSESRM